MTGDGACLGSGPPMLLIHGFTATWRAWDPLLKFLAPGFSVLAPTLPGHTGGPHVDGALDLEYLLRFLNDSLDRAGWEQAHLVGFSLGGWLALELAKSGRARSVSAVSPAGTPDNLTAAEIRRIKWLFRRTRRGGQLARPWLKRLTVSAAFRRRALAEFMVHGDRLSAEEATEMISAHAATPGFSALLASLPRSGGLVELDRVDAPVQVLWGDLDRVLPIRNAAYFRQTLPKAKFIDLAGAGHVPFWDEPIVVADAIWRHANEAETGHWAGSVSPDEHDPASLRPAD